MQPFIAPSLPSLSLFSAEDVTAIADSSTPDALNALVRFSSKASAAVDKLVQAQVQYGARYDVLTKLLKCQQLYMLLISSLASCARMDADHFSCTMA